MKKYLLILSMILVLVGCTASNRPKLYELGELNAVVVNKELRKVYAAYTSGYIYEPIITVKIDTCTYRYAVNPELYEAYSVGDTIKYIGMKYE